MLAEDGTRIDWWIITRDTIFIIIYLIMLTVFMNGNSVESLDSIILLIFYFVHIMMMKFNYIYEVAIKKAVARSMETKELRRICNDDITKFHSNPEG